MTTWKERLAELSDDPWRARAIWGLSALFVCALHLFGNALNIGHAELWLDESSTWGVARRSFGEVLTLPTEFHSQPPLYYLVLHFVMKLSDARGFIRGLSWLNCLLLLQFVLFFVDELTLGARLVFCLLFVYAGITGYLASALRPYGMAAFTTFVATVLFLRLLREPTRRRAVAYAIAALAMLYTMAFDVWVAVAHGACALAYAAQHLARNGPRATIARMRAPLLALVAVGVGYLPYLALVVHWQYRHNASDNTGHIFVASNYFGVADEFFRMSPPLMTALYALIVLGLWGELAAGRALVVTWLLIALGQVAFVLVFMYGRNSIGPTGRYITPALPAACMLAALGFQHLAPRLGRAAWQLVPIGLALVAWPAFGAYRAYLHAPRPIGEWGRLYGAMARRPGDKGVFFDIGYAGQDFEYVIRNDPSVHAYTMRGRHLASGGDDLLDPEYVRRTIDATHATTPCYYYWLSDSNGVYATTFLPEMARLGYKEVGAPSGTHGFCRSE